MRNGLLPTVLSSCSSLIRSNLTAYRSSPRPRSIAMRLSLINAQRNSGCHTVQPFGHIDSARRRLEGTPSENSRLLQQAPLRPPSCFFGILQNSDDAQNKPRGIIVSIGLSSQLNRRVKRRRSRDLRNGLITEFHC